MRSWRHGIANAIDQADSNLARTLAVVSLARRCRKRQPNVRFGTTLSLTAFAAVRVRRVVQTPRRQILRPGNSKGRFASVDRRTQNLPWGTAQPSEAF